MTEKQRTDNILKNNLYLTMATATKSGHPWISPLFYVHDQHNRLYWYSRKTARHSKLLMCNHKVAVTIFDSHAVGDAVDGLYIQGRAREVSPKELKNVLPLYTKKLYAKILDKTKHNPSDFMKESPLRMYVAIPEKLWLVGPAGSYKGKYLDTRIAMKSEGLLPDLGQRKIDGRLRLERGFF